jgi:hypothetical protein
MKGVEIKSLSRRLLVPSDIADNNLVGFDRLYICLRSVGIGELRRRAVLVGLVVVESCLQIVGFVRIRIKRLSG